MQRLEAEATLDVQSMNPELDALLERPFDEDKFRAWSEGTTGWPFFDACMRYLRATGGSTSACVRCCNRLHLTLSGCPGEHQALTSRDSSSIMSQGFIGHKFKCNQE